MTERMNRRIYCMLAKRLDEAELGRVPDRRDARGKRWRLRDLLRAVLGGAVAGKRSLAEQADAQSEDVERGKRVVRRLFIGEATAAPEGWDHLRTVLRVVTETYDASGVLVSCDERYLVSSLPRCRLTAEHWLLVLRRHWGVETAHQILDTAFAEDDHPWIEAHPRAALVVAILRRIAYTILTLFRSVTQRSEDRREVPWKRLMEDVFLALVTTSDAAAAGLWPPLPEPAPT